MKHALLVRIMDGLRDVADHFGRAPRFERTKPKSFRQALTLHIIHGKELLAVMLADLVNGDDVRMPQSGYRLRFAAEPLDAIRAGIAPQQQELHGHGAPETDRKSVV